MEWGLGVVSVTTKEVLAKLINFRPALTNQSTQEQWEAELATESDAKEFGWKTLV